MIFEEAWPIVSLAKISQRFAIERHGITSLPEAADQSAITVEVFRPFTPDRITRLYSHFNWDFLTVFLMPDYLPPLQAAFVDGTLVTAARLLNREIQTYKLELPNINDKRTGAGLLHSNIQKIQNTSKHWGIKQVLQTHDPSSLFKTEQSWLDITAQLATGEISIQDQPELRAPVEDCALGLLDYLQLLARQNGGLVMDAEIEYHLRALIANLNDYRSSISQSV